jgi:hypothetical protein
MKAIIENQLTFEFPNNFDVIKYDDSQFFRKNLIKISDKIKAVDIIAVNHSTTYLIEIKDYRHPNTRSKTVDLVDIVIQKVLSTLSALLPMKMNGTSEEKNIAEKAFSTKRIAVILHLEIPKYKTKIKQSFIKQDNLQIDLKRKIKPIGVYPKVVSKDKMGPFKWKVYLLRLTLFEPKMRHFSRIK